MLIAISAAHGRHALTRLWAEHTASLGFDGVVLCISEGDAGNAAVCSDHGFAMAVMPNEPLAGKFNHALNCALDWGGTRFMILPSDDFASPEWVKAARETEGDYLVPHTCATVSANPPKAYYFHKHALTGQLKFGAGRVISRAAVEKCGGELWPAELNKTLDTASHNRLLDAGFKPKVVTTSIMPIADVKTAENIWPYSTWEWSGRPIPFDQALHMVSEDMRERIKALA